MARRPQKTYSRNLRKRDPNFQEWPTNVGLSLSTLAGNGIIQTGILTVDDNIRVVSCELFWSLDGLTVNDGPIGVGLSHGDYQDSEISEYINAKPTTRNDKIQQERASRGRTIKKVGQFHGNAVNQVLNDGKPIKTRLFMDINQASTLNMYVQNMGPSQLSSGAVVELNGKIWGHWK